MNHTTLHEKFLSSLRNKQQRAVDKPEFDIKEHVLSKRYEDVGIASDPNSIYYESLRRFFLNSVLINDPDFFNCNEIFVVGTVTASRETSHNSALKVFENIDRDKNTYFFEQGFLASSHSWLEANQSGNSLRGCLSYVFDDLSHYFMADYPCRLIHKLNSDASLTNEEVRRARNARQRLVEAKISKYNSQSSCVPSIIEGDRRRVLVCDQAYRDASTIYGKVADQDFEQMLQCALDENPDADIIVKTHPDVHWAKSNKRTGFYTHLKDDSRVKVMRETCNPYILFEQVDKVYVGTSQMGLEALFAGKDVVVFGAPFYAGWGLTDDRAEVPFRNRGRSIDELFYYFYIWYTLYILPGGSCENTIEEVLDYIELKRPVRPVSQQFENIENPRLSVIVPVYNTEDYLGDCIDSVLRQTFSDLELIIVNDASPDESQRIIDGYVERDVRVRVVKMPNNVGLGFARNAGIEAALGDYVFFLDSDDLLASDSVLEKAIAAANAENADLVRLQKYKFNDRQGKDSSVPDHKERYFSTVENYCVKGGVGDLSIFRTWHCWNFLYRKSLIEENKIRFITRKWEERSFICKALYFAEKVHVLPTSGVLYRMRNDSISNSSRSEDDLRMYLANVREVSSVFNGSEASSVVALQFAKTLVSGAWKEQVQRIVLDQEQGQLALLQDAFCAFNISKEANLSNLHILASLGLCERNILLFAASLRVAKWDFVQIALECKAVDLPELFRELLLEPDSPALGDFQYALSVYARNELVSVGQVKSSNDFPEVDARPTIVIHFGSSKTGSTCIQNFMEANKANLLRNGLWFPEIGLYTQDARPHKQAGHVGFVRESIDCRSSFRDYINEGLKVFKRLSAGGSRIHTIVLSSEAFYLNRKSIHIARYFNDFNVKAVGYFRRQDEWANSQYAEFVAGGAIGRTALTFDDWINEAKTLQRLDYFSYLELWASVIGRKNITARIYDRDHFVDRDIVNDFFDAIGLSSLLDGMDPLPSYLSNRFPFNAGHVEYLRIINQRNFNGPKNYLSFVRELEEALQVHQSGKTQTFLNLIDRRQRERVLELVSVSNKKLFEVYLKDASGFAVLSICYDKTPFDISIAEIQKIEEIYSTYGNSNKRAVYQRVGKGGNLQLNEIAAMTFVSKLMNSSMGILRMSMKNERFLRDRIKFINGMDSVVGRIFKFAFVAECTLRKGDFKQVADSVSG